MLHVLKSHSYTKRLTLLSMSCWWHIPEGSLVLVPPPPNIKVTKKNAWKLEYASFLPKPIINPLNKQTN